MSSKKGDSHPAGLGMKPCKTKLGSYIRSRRLKLDMRQIPLSDQVGIPLCDISKLETGSRTHLSDNEIERLARVLQCDSGKLRKYSTVKHVDQPTTALGLLIRKRRQELGITLKELARQMNVTPQYTGRMESGQNPLNQGNRMLQRLADALKIDVNDLLAVRSKRNLKKIDSANPLGTFLTASRVKIHLIQKDVGDRSGMSHAEIGRIERGEKLPNLSQLKRLSEALQCEVPPELLKYHFPHT